MHHDSISKRFVLHTAHEIPSIPSFLDPPEDPLEGGRMLILTRRPAETIYIGEQVTVTVLGVVGNQVRFGIEAPRSITIDRAEIHERKKRAALINAGANVAPASGNVADSHVRDEVAEINGNLADPNSESAAPLKLRR
jgi:carbon storage regulator